MKTEFTKGEWIAVELPKKYGYCTHEIHYSEKGECITDGVYGEANAKLIAAAPDLLEACLEVIKVWNEDGDNGEIQMKTPIAWHRVLRKANQAIKKATEI